jgi:hypothetical protein
MGGRGSGRPAQRAILEQRLRLDIRMFRRRGWLTASPSGVLQWSQDGEAMGEFGVPVRTTADGLQSLVRISAIADGRFSLIADGVAA